MINKIVQNMADAMAGIRDGAVVLLGGFGSIGQPNALIDGLTERNVPSWSKIASRSWELRHTRSRSAVLASTNASSLSFMADTASEAVFCSSMSVLLPIHRVILPAAS